MDFDWFNKEFVDYDEKELIGKLGEVVKMLNYEFNVFEIKKENTRQNFYAGRFDCLSLEDLTKMLKDLQNNQSTLKLEKFCFTSHFHKKEAQSPEKKQNSNAEKNKFAINEKSPEHKDNFWMEIEKNENEKAPQKNLTSNDEDDIKLKVNEKSPGNEESLHEENSEKGGNPFLDKKKMPGEKEKIKDDEEFKHPEMIGPKSEIEVVSKSKYELFQNEIKKGLNFCHKEKYSVESLICSNENSEAVFQVASQFNCLEMVGPNVTPSHGITKYIFDATQGPACALSCSSALFYRNYLVKVKAKENNPTNEKEAIERGQLKTQINLLEDVGVYLDNESNNYWVIRNGYCLTGKRMDELNNKLADNNLVEEVKKKVIIGIHWDTEVNGIPNHKSIDILNKQRVCQVFCSTLAMSYDLLLKSRNSEFCKTILEAMYEATLAAAGILAYLKQKRIKVFLTAVGGGVFGNPPEYIRNAIQKSIEKHRIVPLDVFLVSYSSCPKAYKKIHLDPLPIPPLKKD